MCCNRLFVLPAVFAAMFLLTCCSGRSSREETEGMKDTAEVDSTVFGICGDGSSMNTLQLITGNGDTLSLELVAAYDAGRVFGGYAAGDCMAVILSADSTAALLVINETTMEGKWMLAGNGNATMQMGKNGSIVSSGMPVRYSSWSIVCGKLVMETGGNGTTASVGVQEEAAPGCSASSAKTRYSYELMKLDADSLVFSDTEDSTRIYKYVRSNM